MVISSMVFGGDSLTYFLWSATLFKGNSTPRRPHFFVIHLMPTVAVMFMVYRARATGTKQQLSSWTITSTLTSRGGTQPIDISWSPTWHTSYVTRVFMCGWSPGIWSLWSPSCYRPSRGECRSEIWLQLIQLMLLGRRSLRLWPLTCCISFLPEKVAIVAGSATCYKIK